MKTTAEQLYPAPAHLSDEQAAALPLAGLTAYRAVVTRGKVERGMSVLVTGIGGGVALFALQLAHALGAHVFVTSSDQSKLARAVAVGATVSAGHHVVSCVCTPVLMLGGAQGGVLYTDPKWVDKLRGMLPSGSVDVVIDGAGGESVNSYIKLISIGTVSLPRLCRFPCSGHLCILFVLVWIPCLQAGAFAATAPQRAVCRNSCSISSS